MFSKEDIKPGMLVMLDDGDFGIISYTRNISGLSVIDESGCYLRLLDLNENLESGTGCRIDEIYGFGDNNHAFSFDPEERKLLWKRKPYAKEVTMSEIEKMFGCKVKIVKEEN